MDFYDFICRFLAFFYLVFLLFLKAKLKTAEMWEILMADYTSELCGL